MNKLLKSLITLFLLVILVSCVKEEEKIQNELISSDFEFSNNTVTIFKRYLDQEFAKNRENLVLSMTYHKNNNYSNIFISIKNKQEGFK